MVRRRTSKDTFWYIGRRSVNVPQKQRSTLRSVTVEKFEEIIILRQMEFDEGRKDEEVRVVGMYGSLFFRTE